MPRIYTRLLALTEEAITTLRTIQETQTESQRNAMATRAANDSIKAFYETPMTLREWLNGRVKS